MIKTWNFLICFLSLFLMSCTGRIVNNSPCETIYRSSTLAVIPFSNHTETPLAGDRAMSITTGLLESRGFNNLVVYQNNNSGKFLFPGMNKIESQKKLLSWAHSMHARYAMTGSVNEWSYKVGLDGEPVVGVSLQLIDLSSNRIAWASVASQSGGSRIAVSTVAQELINTMLNGLSNCKSHYDR